MQRLFLASFGLGGLKDFLPKPFNSFKIAFITTAANTYQDKWFIEEDRKKLKDMGLNLVELDIAGKTKEELTNLLKDIKILYFTGGNTFYLLQEIKEIGFDETIKKLVEEGVYYTGASAGAVIAGVDIAPLAPLDDPKEAPNLKSTKGLGFVDIVILPHYGKEKYLDKYKNNNK